MTDQINLEIFCDPSHPGLARPFSIDAWSYATNGHILVRVPRRDDVTENPAAANTSRFCETVKRPRRYKPVKRTRIGSVPYDSRYLSWLQSLPNVEIGPPHKRNPLAFRFDGGGLLMPCGPRRDD